MVWSKSEIVLQRLVLCTPKVAHDALYNLLANLVGLKLGFIRGRLGFNNLGLTQDIGMVRKIKGY